MSRRLLILPCILLFTSCKEQTGESTTPPTQAVQSTSFSFVDITQSSGVSITYRTGRESKHYAILESLGGGGALWDYDLDGSLDLFCPGGGEFAQQEIRGQANFLYRGENGEKWSDVSVLSGCQTSTRYSHGCAVADIDHDGFPDLLVTGYGGLQLWRNQGDGTFLRSEQEAGLLDDQWSSSAAWGDLNSDGHLDLYVAHYVDWGWENDPQCAGGGPDKRDVCPPRRFRGLNDVVYLSTGDGQYQAVSHEIGLIPEGKGLGAIPFDEDISHSHLRCYGLETNRQQQGGCGDDEFTQG